MPPFTEWPRAYLFGNPASGISCARKLLTLAGNPRRLVPPRSYLFFLAKVLGRASPGNEDKSSKAFPSRR